MTFPPVRIATTPTEPLAALGPADALLEALPVACAGLGADFSVRYANATFRRQVRTEQPFGRPLGELIRLEDALQPSLPEQRVRARLPDGEAVLVRLSARPDGHAAVLLPVMREENEERVLLALGRDTIAATSEEEVVAALAKALRALFPGAFYCVRVVDPRTCALTSLYAEGKLKEGARQSFVISRSAADKLGLDKAELPRERVQVVEEPPLVFAGSVRGSCTPLAASGSLFGVLNVEFPPGDARDLRADERVVIRLANQAALGLRNVKLFEEVSYVRRYLEQLIEHANALIVVVNAEKKIIVFNQAIARLSGYRREQVLGREFLGFIPEAEHKRVARLVVSSLRGGPVANFETAILGADGRTIRVAFSTAAVRTAAGEVEGVIAVGQDLTQLRNLEDQVIQAEKLASLGQLAAGVAHEINNPLTTISIYADALVRKLRTVLAFSPVPGGPVSYGDATDLEKLTRILEASDRILKLARDLTSYARPSPEQAEPLDVHLVLDQAVAFCDHVLKESEVHLVRNYTRTVAPVPALRSNLVQVFVNLLTNACHATPAGGTVQVTTGPGPQGGVEIRVSDTGSGIAPENLGRIFEPFFTTKAEGRGTGLGLSIVQGIVAKHGGTIEVQSTVGEGTTFVVRLPGAE